MTAGEPNAFRATHNVASEVHRVMGARGLTTAELARKIGESERFLSEILQGEDSLDRRVNIRLLQEIANATKRTLIIRIPPWNGVQTVQPDDGGPL